jgi:hypothetical protein
MMLWNGLSETPDEQFREPTDHVNWPELLRCG